MLLVLMKLSLKLCSEISELTEFSQFALKNECAVFAITVDADNLWVYCFVDFSDVPSLASWPLQRVA